MAKLLSLLTVAGFLFATPVLAASEDFEKADADGDGKLTMEEAAVSMPDLTQEQFESADVDGDGMLSLEEFEALEK